MKKVAPKPKKEEPAANEIWSATHFEKIARQVVTDLRANKVLLVYTRPVGTYKVTAPSEKRKFASLSGRFPIVASILKDKESIDGLLKSARMFFFVIPADQVSEEAMKFHVEQQARREKELGEIIRAKVK